MNNYSYNPYVKEKSQSAGTPSLLQQLKPKPIQPLAAPKPLAQPTYAQPKPMAQPKPITQTTYAQPKPRVNPSYTQPTYKAPSPYAQSLQTPKPIAQPKQYTTQEMLQMYIPKPSAEELDYKRKSQPYIDAYNNRQANIQPAPVKPAFATPPEQQRAMDMYLSNYNKIKASPTGTAAPYSTEPESEQQKIMNQYLAHANRIKASSTPAASRSATTSAPAPITQNTAPPQAAPMAIDTIKPVSDRPQDPMLGKSWDDWQKLQTNGNSLYGDGAYSEGFDKTKLDDDLSAMYDTHYNAYLDTKGQYDKLQSNYDIQQKNASERKRQESINQELFKKYLPTYLKSQGLGGLGVSQSTLAQLEGDYRNRVAGIDSDSNQAMQQYLKYYNENYENLHGANGTVKQKQNEIDSERKAVNQSLAFDALETERGRISLTDVDGVLYYTPEQIAELEKLLQKYGSKLSSGKKLQLETDINIYRSMTNDFMNEEIGDNSGLIGSDRYANDLNLLFSIAGDRRNLFTLGNESFNYNGSRYKFDTLTGYANGVTKENVVEKAKLRGGTDKDVVLVSYSGRHYLVKGNNVREVTKSNKLFNFRPF